MAAFRLISDRDRLVAQVLAGMSYLGILALVPFMIGRRDPFVAFHARQGIIIWIWEVIAVYALIVPGLGKIAFQLSSVLCFVLSLVGLVSVILGRAWRLPGVSSVAEKL
ncbi:conserved hypothetical protein [Magnetococcus marinus MC-1]|uniref:Magnetosome protein MamF n=1 Tax=Magnetococcus marinus (strain ATCC BAA-1437 / JCM 17883 / MC-1) TaxID=156889 RepID=A0L9W6_MAGMM|nr:hypothetical protein [Magnetococcus marinus]ABK44759.1 conserved hypothetical protein [Magnetococcus marinus MC-1]